MADLPVPQTSADEVRRITQEVLSRPEFAQAAPAWWERPLDRIVEFIARVLALIGEGRRGSIIGTIVLVAVLAAGGAAIVWFTRSMRRGGMHDVDRHAQLGRTPDEWLADAAAHGAAGRWRDAVRCRYRALLAHYAAAGLLEEIAGRTSGEYLAAVQVDVPTAADAFADVTARFDAAWYGHDPVAASDVEAFAAAAREALKAAQVRRRHAVEAAA